MAENLETPSFGNFSIENTMDMGMGNAELLNDLMGPETASSTPDDIKEITEEDKAPKETKKAATKSIGETMDEGKAPEKEDASKSIEDFLLGGDDDEEEEEEEAPAAKQKTKAPEAKVEEVKEEAPLKEAKAKAITALLKKAAKL